MYWPDRPAIVTVMLTEPSTTWLLVSTSPDGVTIIPVPAAALLPFDVWTTVLMSTIAGSTLAAMADALMVPLLFNGGTAEIGALEVGGSLVCGRVAVCVTGDELCR